MTTNANTDATFQIVLNLMQELWVVKDRAAMLEKVLEDAGISVAETVDSLQPDETKEAELDQQRKAFIARVLAPTLEAGSS